MTKVEENYGDCLLPKDSPPSVISKNTIGLTTFASSPAALSLIGAAMNVILPLLLEGGGGRVLFPQTGRELGRKIFDLERDRQ